MFESFCFKLVCFINTENIIHIFFFAKMVTFKKVYLMVYKSSVSFTWSKLESY